MRALAPLLVLSTLALLGTGVTLLALGPDRHKDLIVSLHRLSFFAWVGLMSVHVLVYARRLPGLVFSRGRLAVARAGVVAGSLLAGAVLAGATYSLAGARLHRGHEHEGARASLTGGLNRPLEVNARRTQ